MKRSLLLPLFLLLCTMSYLFHSCESESSPQETLEEVEPSKKLPVPRFQKDSAYAYIAKQLSYGPRVVGSPASKACKDWMVAHFKACGATVIEQDFKANVYTGESFDGTNIIAQFNPGVRKRIVLAAHWDSRHIADSPLSTERQDEPILGADDGGSGTGVLMEVARILKENPLEIGIDIVLFDAEDYGNDEGNDPYSWGLGSQYWSKNLHASNYKPKYGILLDMVGSKGARFLKEDYSMQFAGPIVNKIWKLAQNMGYGNYFIDQRGGAVTDDHYFVNTIARIPMLDIINKPVGSQTGFGEYWHTHNDNLDIIDRRTLNAVGQVVLAVIYKENNNDF